MADGKKTRRNNNTFRRIWREEAEAGATVVAASRQVCSVEPLPCIMDIMVLAGLQQPCAICAPHIQTMRDCHGFKPEGRFWTSDQLTEDQQRSIRHRIGQADVNNWVNADCDNQD